ncbi:dihydroorotase [Natrinema versiforme]|uniref:D-hydantoinase n=1 Tax=Natrinema versiforme JCM 10478 TaxID=1227496 RepID=L9XVU7_9EURY|nr:amidohydrolase family protein [Natrinema versiforme]ELY65526.1 D-hydantoinase [Natrinema versiforme JCM 10478]
MSPETVDTIIADGTVVTPTGTIDAAVAIDGETIAAVGAEESLPVADQRIDASDRLVMPGVIDPHVHVGEDPFTIDTYQTASEAAALGGTTTFVNFAWEGWDGETSIYEPETTLVEGIRAQKEAAADALVDHSSHGVLATERDATIEQLEPALEEGVTSFKLFTAYEHGVSYGFMNQALRRIAELDAVGIFHTEDATVCDQLTEQFRAEGKGDPEWYPRSRPDYAEAMAADDVARMAQEAGAKYYGLHTSCRKSAEVLERYQDDGSQIRAETCTHYTVYDDSVFAERGNLPMIAPPIRKPDDVDAMFEHLRGGALSVVSTDHCGYKRESKEVENWWDSTFGANALQTSLPVFHDEAVHERGFSYPALVRLMSTNPARTFGMPEKGTLEPGTDADVVVFDPAETYTIDADENGSEADFSIYEGRDVTGRVEQTFVRGELVADDGEIVADPGHGSFVERDLPDWEQ